LLAGGPLTSVLSAAFGVQAELGDRGDVNAVVDASVPGLGQAVSVLLARGCIQECGAGPGSESVAVGEPGDVTDIGEDPGGDDGTDAMNVLQP